MHKSHHHLQIGLFTLYIIIATILMIKQGVGITPDRYIFVLLIPVLFLHKASRFLHDFVPFILIILGYEFLRGFADDLNPTIHFQEPIKINKLMFFGHIPTVDLQTIFYTPGSLHWYDFAATYFYLLHFAVPLAFALLLWLKNKSQFREFSLGLSLLSYFALIIYFIYPTAPPWLASKMGYIPEVTKIFNVVLVKYPESIHLPTIYERIGTNVVAAIPSLHTGYSFLVFLYALRFFGRVGFLSFPYPFLMWLATVYLGEHYVIDILAGIALCLVVFVLTKSIMNQLEAD